MKKRSFSDQVLKLADGHLAQFFKKRVKGRTEADIRKQQQAVAEVLNALLDGFLQIASGSGMPNAMIGSILVRALMQVSPPTVIIRESGGPEPETAKPN